MTKILKLSEISFKTANQLPGAWLGKTLWQEVEPGNFLKAAAALWPQPEYEALDEIVPSSRDEAHFLFLLQLAAERSVQREAHILLICRPRWCFKHAAENPMGAFGYSSLAAGRLYPERVPSGSFRRKRQDK